MKLSDPISDLFFSLDHNDSKVYDDYHHFVGFDEAKLLASAEDFVNMLGGAVATARGDREGSVASLVHVCTPAQIVADFLGRV